MDRCLNYEDISRYMGIQLEACSSAQGRFLEEVEQHLATCEACHQLFMQLLRQNSLNEKVLGAPLHFSEQQFVRAQLKEMLQTAQGIGSEIQKKMNQWIARSGAYVGGNMLAQPLGMLGFSGGAAEQFINFQMPANDNEQAFLEFAVHEEKPFCFYVPCKPESTPPILCILDTENQELIRCLIMDTVREISIASGTISANSVIITDLTEGKYLAVFCDLGKEQA